MHHVLMLISASRPGPTAYTDNQRIALCKGRCIKIIFNELYVLLQLNLDILLTSWVTYDLYTVHGTCRTVSQCSVEQQ